jgi:hypothetical protein
MLASGSVAQARPSMMKGEIIQFKTKDMAMCSHSLLDETNSGRRSQWTLASGGQIMIKSPMRMAAKIYMISTLKKNDQENKVNERIETPSHDEPLKTR